MAAKKKNERKEKEVRNETLEKPVGRDHGGGVKKSGGKFSQKRDWAGIGAQENTRSWAESGHPGQMEKKKRSIPKSPTADRFTLCRGRGAARGEG